MALIWVTKDGNSNYIEILNKYTSIKVPKHQVGFIAAVAFFMMYQNAFSMAFIERTIINLTNVIDRRRGIALTIVYGSNAIWSMPLTVMSYFFKRPRGFEISIAIFTLLMFLPFGIFVISVYFSIFLMFWNGLFESESMAETWVSLAGGLLLMACPLHAAITLVPNKPIKNEGLIRWIFLFRIWEKYSIPQNSVKRWINEHQRKN